MKKIERINTIMRYINNRSYFTISEIMREFNISRSTALRDIREVEAIGLPLQSEVGRGGGYAVLNNAILPSINFSDDEVKVLFIAFMASRNQQLPYLKSRQSLSEKLLGLISESQQEILVTLNETLLFEGTVRNYPDLLELTDLPHPILEKLIRYTLTDRHLILSIEENNVVNSYFVYLLYLYRENNYWQIEAFDLISENLKILPVDFLIDVKIYPAKKPTNKKEVLNKIKQKKNAYNLVITLGQPAIDQFKKYHPSKFSLSYTDPHQAWALLRGFINVNNQTELKETVNLLLFLGEDIKFLKVPKEVNEQLNKRLNFYS